MTQHTREREHMGDAERARLELDLATAKATVARLELILNPECKRCGSQQRLRNGDCAGCDGAAAFRMLTPDPITSDDAREC